jgi:molecular chaperone GrpE
MADEKSPSNGGVMKETADAPEAPEETTMDEDISDSVSPNLEDLVKDASDEDGDSASLETQIEELKAELLRSHADVQNVCRRAERDVENAHKYAVEKFVKDLLAVLDSMDRALDLAETTEGFDAAVLEGTQMTHKLLLDTSAKHGVESIDPLGEIFNPQEHQAMSMVESAEHESNSVMAVMQKGYKLEGRVIRAAMVVVSKPSTN